ncbi:MAG: cytochrome c [Acidobacteriaceae bacterium]|nr:cytochrome c [Acidobacteriaceae bacterium]
MATRKKSSGSGFGKFLLGFLCAAVIAAGGAWWYLHRGKPITYLPLSEEAPAAVAPVRPVAKKAVPHQAVAPSFESLGKVSPDESAAGPVKTIPAPPFAASEDAFEAGAVTYRKRCAGCHGAPGHDAPNGLALPTPAKQFFRAGGLGAKSAGAIYVAIRDGNHKAGMPAYSGVLPDSSMWDVALLLKAANQPLPDPVVSKLGK